MKSQGDDMAVSDLRPPGPVFTPPSPSPHAPAAGGFTAMRVGPGASAMHVHIVRRRGGLDRHARRAQTIALAGPATVSRLVTHSRNRQSRRARWLTMASPIITNIFPSGPDLFVTKSRTIGLNWS